MKSIGEIMNGMGAIQPPSAPRSNVYDDALRNEPLAETIKREYKRICEEKHLVFYPDQQTLRLIESVADFIRADKHRWLVICGPRGLGKSEVLHATRAALKARKEYRIPELFSSFDIRDFAANGDPLFTWIKKDFSFVAIDDLGAEIPKNGSSKPAEDSVNNYGTKISPLQTVLEERSNKWLRTIITTNESPDFIKAYYGLRAFDRISQEGVVKVILLSGQSFRIVSGEERMKRWGPAAHYDSF